MSDKAISIIPFPDGKDFAVSFVDDTDLSTRANTEPIYALLASLGMMGTKTVWVFDQKRSSAFRKDKEKNLTQDLGRMAGDSLEDPDYLSFVLDLKKMGFEIALHNVAAGNSLREEIVEGIDRFRYYFNNSPRINAFHQTNIENLYAGRDKLDIPLLKFLEWVKDRSAYQGHLEQSDYFWGDIALCTIDYFRLPFHNIQEPNTLKVNPSMPFHDLRRPFVKYWFSSSDGSNCRRFIRLLSPSNIEKLKNERGACLIYTHFAKGFTERRKGKFCLNREFKSLVEVLAKNVNSWFPTASNLLDRLLIVKQISIVWDGFNIVISNDSKTDIPGLTILGPSGLRLTDTQDNELHSSAENKIIFPELPKKSRSVFRSNMAGSFVLQKKGEFISRRERRYIELLNYYGLLKQTMLKL
jgi:hypothetical protein